MLNQGGEGQILEVLFAISGPFVGQPIDFSWLSARCFDWEYHALHLLAIRLVLVATWRAWMGGTWWNAHGALHVNILEKIETSFGWTWESNPGPSGYQTHHLPLRHSLASDNIITINHNIWKPTHVLENKTRAPLYLNGPTMRQHVIIFILSPVK